MNRNNQTIKSVWSQNVNVSAGKKYEFKAYVQNIFSASPAILRFYAGTDLIGTYSPTGIATYGEFTSLCAPTSSARYADDVTTPNEVVGVEVYPNPFTDETIVSITTGDLDNTATVVVNNFLGQVVRSERVNVSSSSVINHYMNFSGLKSGVYFITVETNTYREVVKVVKQ